MSSQQDRLLIGVGNHVVALDKRTGAIAWKTEVPFTTSELEIHVEGDRVYAGGMGEVACLDAKEGGVLWHNALKGLGLGDISFPAASAVDVARAIASL